MQISRWRNFSSLKTHIIPLSPASTYLSSAFHSTPCPCQKWKNKWNSDVRRNQQPSKNHVRFVTRQKRADAKKALNNLLYNSGSSRFSSQNKETRWKLEEKRYWYGDQDDHSDSYDNKGQPKSRPHFGKSQKRKKRKIGRESFYEDFDGHAETIFHATFGNRWSTWSFNGWRGSFGDSTSGFEQREHSNWTNSRSRNWKSASDAESDDDSCCIGLRSDRTILGLPPTGPLKIDDVKNACRLSALKWHPDKHQGPSQAMAEEKFKLCVNAYKSLCSAISSA